MFRDNINQERASKPSRIIIPGNWLATYLTGILSRPLLKRPLDRPKHLLQPAFAVLGSFSLPVERPQAAPSTQPTETAPQPPLKRRTAALLLLFDFIAGQRLVVDGVRPLGGLLTKGTLKRS